MKGEKIYRYITEKASDIIYTISLDSKITFHNKSIEKIFDTSIELIEQEHYDNFMLPQDKEFAKKLHSDIFKGIYPPIFEHAFKTQKGKLVYLECSVTPLFDEHNKVNGALGIARDVTEKRLAQEKIKDSNKNLEESIKEKDKFLSMIAHDLRDPFNILIGYSDLILDNFNSLSKDELKKYVLVINSSSNNSFNLLKNLIDWSNTESGRIIFTPKKLNLSTIIEFTILSLKYAASSKKINISFKFENDYYVFADENMLKTVLRNLISNAIKFSYKNTEILINLFEEKSNFIVTITDSGIGISKENLHKIFSPEFSLSQKGTMNEKGTGLGLKICNEFVNKWGGKIWAESNNSKGSSFSFSIPK